MVYCGPFILTFLPTPRGLRWVDALQAHYFWQLGRCNNPKEMDIFGEALGSLVGGLEIFLANPWLLHFMDLSAQEVSGGGHLLKSRGEVIWPLLLKVGPVGLIIGLLGTFMTSDSLKKTSQEDSLRASSLQQRFLEALVASNCSRAIFIFSCSRRSISDRPAGTTLGGTCTCWPPPVSSVQ